MAQVEALLARYYRDEDPKLYTPLEAKALCDWLIAGGEADPLLISLLDYDIAFMKLVREGQPQCPSLASMPDGGTLRLS